MAAPRVFFYVQHLLGIGHLRRALTLARAMLAQGLEVTLASGGPAVPGLSLEAGQFVQLPSVRAIDPSFKLLVDEAGNPIDEAWRDRRREALLAAWRQSGAHALVVELYPFGRRQMRFELEPLLETARARARPPVIISSARDLLGGRHHDPARQDEILAAFERHFDHVLVHSDPALVTFDKTFRRAAGLAGRLHYTGYVVDAPVRAGARGTAGTGEVVVSAGGGAVGARLLETAILARAATRLAANTWRVLPGANATPEALAALRTLAGAGGGNGIVVERSRPDFTTLLENCVVSVSQAGYNTFMELLQARARAVVVPFAGGNETEQTLRAELFASRGLVEMIGEHSLTAHALAAAIDRAASKPRPSSPPVDLGGAATSARMVARWAQERR